MTLPIIREVKQGILSSDWRQTLTFEDARNLLAGEGILSDIKKEAQFYVGQALSILDEFADNMARKQLKALAEFIGIRSC